MNIPAVLDTIGCEVTREQKEVIRKDLLGALEAFIKRENGTLNESEKLPFISVNRRTNKLAIHSRLLIALQLAVKKSVKALGIEMGGEAFDEVRSNSKGFEKVPQLSRAADEICRGESVDCKNFVTARRLDGKCNNLRNTNWGASAIAMRRMAPTAYHDGLHTPRKVHNHHNFPMVTNK